MSTVTPRDGLIGHLCAWKGIRTHEQANIFTEVHGRPDWQALAEKGIHATAVELYEGDPKPNTIYYYTCGCKVPKAKQKKTLP